VRFSDFDILSHAVVQTLRISTPTVVESLLGRVDREVCDARLVSWSRKLLERAHVALEIRGREHVAAGEVYLVMSNHHSLYDIPVLFQAFPGTLRMVAKTELFRVPIWGAAMRASGFVEIDRGHRERARESLRLARERMCRERISIWIAPEGTRSRDGRLGAFKKGPFHLAVDAGLPVLPATIVGTFQVLQKGGERVARGAPVRVTFHPPIDPATYGGDRDALSADVRRAIASAMPSP
jgi:1-acyl-sn-glycerol-3-phosphate acyltransferase